MNNTQTNEIKIDLSESDSVEGSNFSTSQVSEHAKTEIFINYEQKPANRIFRWNLLWLLLLLLAPYPLWLSFINCSLSYEITIILNIFLTLNFTYATVLCWMYMWRMLQCSNKSYLDNIDEDSKEKISHIVVMPTYKEPLELLMETIDSIAKQTIARSIIMVVGMEEKTPDQESKKQRIRQRFGNDFKALVFSVHPYGVKGEIAGACSNRNFAARTAVQYMLKNNLLRVDPSTGEPDLDHTTVTVCDADTTFFRKYFENLTHAFLKESEEKRYEVCWQSPLFYNIALDKRWSFTRIMGILRSFFMIGFLIGCDINTMSIYSMSLRLLVKSQFFHPGYQMDDIIYTLSAMRATGKRIRIRLLDVPTLSGPTSGVNIAEEFKEWVIQATRWTIGAAEVFHYFFVKLLKRNYFLPGLLYFWWFVYYYGVVLCMSGLVQLSTFIIQMVSFQVSSVAIDQCRPFDSWLGLPESFPYGWVLPTMLLFTYFIVFLTAFFMDALIRQVMSLKEHINPWRNVMHFLMTQIVLWVYCLVEYRAILIISIYGKSVCGHKASQKHALVGVDKLEVYKVSEPEAVSDLSFVSSDSDSDIENQIIQEQNHNSNGDDDVKTDRSIWLDNSTTITSTSSLPIGPASSIFPSD